MGGEQSQTLALPRGRAIAAGFIKAGSSASVLQLDGINLGTINLARGYVLLDAGALGSESLPQFASVLSNTATAITLTGALSGSPAVGFAVWFFSENTIQVAVRNATVSWTIANTAAISNSNVDLGGRPLLALLIPAGYEGGNITFQSCDTAGGTYVDVYDSAGTLVTATVAGASRVVALTGTALQALSALQFVMIRTTSNVAADRLIVAITKG
jgi:hypothetical protein